MTRSSAEGDSPDPDGLFLDGTHGQPPPYVSSATDPSIAFIQQRIADLEAELAQPPTESGSSVGPSSATSGYTARQAASSLSELGARLDALVGSAEGDMVEAQRRLERLAFELGREKDAATQTLPNGTRRPSFAPKAELSRHDVQTVMDSWTLSLERALITALHPASKRLCADSRAYLTYRLGDKLVLDPRRVAAIVTRAAMTAVIQRTSDAVDTELDPFAAETSMRANLENYIRLAEPGVANDSVRGADDKFLTVSQLRKARIRFDISTRAMVETIATQLELEYYHEAGLLASAPNPGVSLSRSSVQAALSLASLAVQDRAAIDRNTLDKTPSLDWKDEHKYKLGGAVLAIALEVWSMRPVGLPGSPAFRSIKGESRPGDERRFNASNVLRPDPALVQMLVNAAPDVRFLARDLPMICPPRLWPTAKNGLDRSENQGGFLLRETGIVKRMSTRERKEPILKAMKDGEMDDLLEAVNTISSNPWRVNSAVLDVIVDAIHPDRSFFQAAIRPKDASPLGRIASLVKPHHLLPLNIARAYADRVFYLPHNLDYRGRIYSLSPYLHPPGDDFSRGLLTFGTKRALGPDGLYWLKVHLSGVYGKDKESFDDRVRWVDSQLDQVRASARDPKGETFWLDGDKPFQILAACIEIENALRSGEVETYESSLPVHMDGTCNGMQYYAALGRDLQGGKSVNLTPNEVPQDVYGEVLTVVRELIGESDDDGWRPIQEHGPALLQRKTVKTTVMTSVYGVTQQGAEAQVNTALTELNGTLPAKDQLSVQQVKKLSTKLASTILLSIGKLFPVATSIQEWLGTCLDLIVHSRDNATDPTAEHSHSMQWTTPLGLPVVQGYREPVTKIIKTQLQKFTVVDNGQVNQVLPRREHNGFAPNFIHSLDASHLFMTVNDCTRKGVTFGSVHDSFWTHAATVPDLNASLRDAFVKLHSDEPNLLERLRNQVASP